MHVNSGDTAWLLVSAALVMFMTPGLAFFYGGLVRSKNVVGTIMQSFIALGLVTVLWALIGYTLAFGPDKAGLIGGLDFLGLSGVGAAPSAYAPTVPATSFMVFQMMFAIITPALIAGAFAERMRFSGYLMFIGLWSLLRLRSPGPLGVGRRLPRRRRDRRAGLRGWRGGACERGCGCAGHRDLPGPAPRARLGRHVAPQRPVRRSWVRGSCGSDGSGSMPGAPSRPARSPPVHS